MAELEGEEGGEGDTMQHWVNDLLYEILWNKWEGEKNEKERQNGKTEKI